MYLMLENLMKIKQCLINPARDKAKLTVPYLYFFKKDIQVFKASISRHNGLLTPTLRESWFFLESGLEVASPIIRVINFHITRLSKIEKVTERNLEELIQLIEACCD